MNVWTTSSHSWLYSLAKDPLPAARIHLPMADEETLRPIREAIEQAGESSIALRRLQPLEETRGLRWRCSGCAYLKHFTRPTPAEVARRMPLARWRLGPADVSSLYAYYSYVPHSWCVRAPPPTSTIGWLIDLLVYSA